MVRSFGGYFGLQTAPSIWGGAPGIWSIRDVAYFQQQAQWPGAGTQFAAIAFSHGPGDIGGAPYLSVYRYLPGNANTAPGGIATKYPSPSDTVGYKNYGLAFSQDNLTIASGASEYNYYNFYRWSDSGFGTRYSSPSDTGNLVIMDIHFNSSSNCVALACSTFDIPQYTYANGISYTTSLYVYKWDPVNGFGTKFADPSGTVPYVPESTFKINISNQATPYDAHYYPSANRYRIRGLGTVSFNSDTSALIHANGEWYQGAYVYNFSPTSGFGSLIATTYSNFGLWTNDVNGIKAWRFIKAIQINSDDAFVMSQTTNALNASYANLTTSFVGNLGGTASFKNRTFNYTRFNPTTSGIGAIKEGGGYNFIHGDARIGNKVRFGTGSNALAVNTSIVASKYYNTSESSGYETVALNTIANNYYTTANLNVITQVFTGTSTYPQEYLYATGVDVSPNGREAVYSLIGGTNRTYYVTLNSPISHATSPTLVSSLAQGLPSGAYKARFNYFQQDP